MDPSNGIDSITCRNRGAFVMKCHVKWQVADGPITQSDYSGEFPVGQEQTFDLNVFDIPHAASVWAHYEIEAGRSGDTQTMLFGRNSNIPAIFEIWERRSIRTATWSGLTRHSQADDRPGSTVTLELLAARSRFASVCTVLRAPRPPRCHIHIAVHCGREVYPREAHPDTFAVVPRQTWATRPPSRSSTKAAGRLAAPTITC